MQFRIRALLYACGLWVFCSNVLVLSLTDLPQNVRNALSQVSERPTSTHNLDPYETFPASFKQYWRHGDGSTINQTIKTLLDYKLPITMNVRLVGFFGDGNQQVVMSELDLLGYVRMISADLHSVVLNTGRPLVVQPELNFQLSRAPPTLSAEITAAVRRATQDSSGGGVWNSLTVIPHGVTDEIIHRDHTGVPKGAYFTLYILNPAIPTVPYIYSYVTRQPNQYGAACHGTHWVSPDMAYAWIDLSAGPSSYGPGRGMDGQVLLHSIPRLEYYKKGLVKSALPSDLTALTLTAARHLVWPPLALKPLPASDELEVHVVRIHSALLPPTQGERVSAQLLSNALAALQEVQMVTVKEHTIGFASCGFCAAAYSRSIRSRSVRRPESMAYVTVQDYLDSEELHAALAEHGDGILATVGVRTDDLRSKGHRRVMPVFIYELSTIESVTLDDGLQTVAFPDMAIGVWTAGLSGGPSNFYCWRDAVMIQSNNITRPMIASVLQSAWGVADTSTYWSAATGEQQNFLWSVGSTPFGPMGMGTTASSAQSTAAMRNIVLNEINDTITAVIDLLKGFDHVSIHGHLEKVLNKVDLATFYTRMNLLNFRVKRAMQTLAERNFRMAVRYARMLNHDVDVLYNLSQKLNRELSVEMQCHTTVAVSWMRYPMFLGGGALLVVAVLVWQQRGSKPKRDW